MPPTEQPEQPRRKRRFGNIYRSRGRFRVRYSIRGVRYDVDGGETEDDAEAVLARLTLDRARARLDGRPLTAPVTLAEFEPRVWGVWTATLRPATRSTRRAVLRHYRELLRGPMRNLTPPEAEAALYQRLALGIAPVSVESERRVLSSVWQLAERMQVVGTNPWRGARLPKADVEPHRRLTDAELEGLFRGARQVPERARGPEQGEREDDREREEDAEEHARPVARRLDAPAEEERQDGHGHHADGPRHLAPVHGADSEVLPGGVDHRAVEVARLAGRSTVRRDPGDRSPAARHVARGLIRRGKVGLRSATLGGGTDGVRVTHVVLPWQSPGVGQPRRPPRRPGPGTRAPLIPAAHSRVGRGPRRPDGPKP